MEFIYKHLIICISNYNIVNDYHFNFQTFVVLPALPKAINLPLQFPLNLRLKLNGILIIINESEYLFIDLNLNIIYYNFTDSTIQILLFSFINNCLVLKSRHFIKSDHYRKFYLYFNYVYLSSYYCFNNYNWINYYHGSQENYNWKLDCEHMKEFIYYHCIDIGKTKAFHLFMKWKKNPKEDVIFAGKTPSGVPYKVNRFGLVK